MRGLRGWLGDPRFKGRDIFLVAGQVIEFLLRKIGNSLNSFRNDEYRRDLSKF